MTDSWMDTPVMISGEKPMRMTAAGMRALVKATGRPLSDVMGGDEDEADRFQAIAFLELHRRAARTGHMPDAGTLWDQAGLVEIDVSTDSDLNRSVLEDPTGGGPSPTSPRSAGTGE